MTLEEAKAKQMELYRQFAGKKLGMGRFRLGPEYFGCFNTGHRPKIMRNGIDGRYYVGEELDFWPEMRERSPKMYKTKSSAVKHFMKLCEVVIDYNLDCHRKAEKAEADLRSKDYERAVQGAQILSDIGVI